MECGILTFRVQCIPRSVLTGVAYCLGFNFEIKILASHLSGELNMDGILGFCGRLRFLCFCINQSNCSWDSVMSNFFMFIKVVSLFSPIGFRTYHCPKLDLLRCISFLADRISLLYVGKPHSISLGSVGPAVPLVRLALVQTWN